jgi:hypothetical protein
MGVSKRLSGSRKPACEQLVVKRTATGNSVGADGWEKVLRRSGQPEKLVCDAQDQLHPIGYSKLVVQALDVRVNGVRRNAKISGDSEFGAVVKNAAHDLQFTSG